MPIFNMPKIKTKVEEDAPANSVAGGGVAGINPGEVVVRKKPEEKEPPVLNRQNKDIADTENGSKVGSFKEHIIKNK